MKFHEDDRAQRLIDIFQDLPNGQVNVSYVNSTEHITAWHRHWNQTDYLCCLKGSFKVGLATPTEWPGQIEEEMCEIDWEYLSDKNPRVLEISPTIWHGYKALEPGSIMLYYMTRKYDPKDVEKCFPGTFGEEWETISK